MYGTKLHLNVMVIHLTLENVKLSFIAITYLVNSNLLVSSTVKI